MFNYTNTFWLNKKSLSLDKSKRNKAPSWILDRSFQVYDRVYFMERNRIGMKQCCLFGATAAACLLLLDATAACLLAGTAPCCYFLIAAACICCCVTCVLAVAACFALLTVYSSNMQPAKWQLQATTACSITQANNQQSFCCCFCCYCCSCCWISERSA